MRIILLYYRICTVRVVAIRKLGPVISMFPLIMSHRSAMSTLKSTSHFYRNNKVCGINMGIVASVEKKRWVLR